MPPPVSPGTPVRRSSRKRPLSPSGGAFAEQLAQYAHNPTSLLSPARKKRTASKNTTEPCVDIEQALPEHIPATSPIPSRISPKLETISSPGPWRSKNRKPIQMSLASPNPAAPHNWQLTYARIKAMRMNTSAPVDGMGCANAGDTETDPKARRLAVLISLMMSSQTSDEIVSAAIKRLKLAMPKEELTVDNILAMDDATMRDTIYPVGMYNKKVGYIKTSMRQLKEDFDSDVPKTVDELCSLHGVGPKMAFLALQAAWNIKSAGGIGVDTHLHRITNLLGWHKTKDPEQTRLALSSWLPVELCEDINPLLVGFGQTICIAKYPRCDKCTLSGANGESRLCPSAKLSSGSGNVKSSPKKARAPARTGTTMYNGGVKLEGLEAFRGVFETTSATLSPMADRAVKLKDVKLEEDDAGAPKMMIEIDETRNIMTS